MERIRKAGVYRRLRSFQTATIIYDATYWFCEKFLDSRSRTIDQMVQAARSGRQNIAEGSRAGATSSQSELRLVNVARGSLEELLLDYEDFIRQRKRTKWNRNSDEARTVRGVVGKNPDWHDVDDAGRAALYANWLESDCPFKRANALICLIHQANYLLDQHLNGLEKAFVDEGGYTEKLATARLEQRQKNTPSSGDLPACPECGKPMVVRTAQSGARQGEKFLGCSAFPVCRGTRRV